MLVIPGRPCAPKPQSSRLSFSPRPAEPVERSTQPGPGTPLLGAACVFHLISQSSCKAGCAQTPPGPGAGTASGCGRKKPGGREGNGAINHERSPLRREGTAGLGGPAGGAWGPPSPLDGLRG